jgi:hypothetical protein
MPSGWCLSTFRKNLLSRSVSQASSAFLRAWSLVQLTSTQMIEVLRSFETSTNFCQTTRHHIAEDSTLHIRVLFSLLPWRWRQHTHRNIAKCPLAYMTSHHRRQYNLHFLSPYMCYISLPSVIFDHRNIIRWLSTLCSVVCAQSILSWLQIFSSNILNLCSYLRVKDEARPM